MEKEILSEKVSVNINTSTLSQIDLLVDNGYYSNRSDFINHALRSSLEENRATIERLIEQNSKRNSTDHDWFIGVSGYTPKDIEEMYAKGQKTTVFGYGVFILDQNCDIEKVFAVIESIKVRGKVVCSAEIKKHYGLK